MNYDIADVPEVDSLSVVQPAPIKAFIDTVIRTPLSGLPDLLAGFTWTFEKVCIRLIASVRVWRQHTNTEIHVSS